MDCGTFMNQPHPRKRGRFFERIVPNFADAVSLLPDHKRTAITPNNGAQPRVDLHCSHALTVAKPPPVPCCVSLSTAPEDLCETLIQYAPKMNAADERVPCESVYHSACNGQPLYLPRLDVESFVCQSRWIGTSWVRTYTAKRVYRCPFHPTV